MLAYRVNVQGCENGAVKAVVQGEIACQCTIFQHNSAVGCKFASILPKSYDTMTAAEQGVPADCFAPRSGLFDVWNAPEVLYY